MGRKFQKGYTVGDCYWAEIELEDDEIEGMTEEEILEMADERLWQEATSSALFDLVDDVMDEPEEIYDQGLTKSLIHAIIKKKKKGKEIMFERVIGVNAVWVPSFVCEDDAEKNACIQDLADCVLIDRESAKKFANDLMKVYEKEWKDICDVSPHLVFECENESEFTWYGWEFMWDGYKCAMYLQETPILRMKNAD